MSKTRYIKTDFWSDSFIETLSTEEKLLFIYLFSNERVDLCWIYEITIKKISFESWIDIKKVESILDKFSKKWKVYYIDWYVYIKNFVKHLQINPSMKLWIDRSRNALPKPILEAIDRLGTGCIQDGTLIPIPILWLEPEPILWLEPLDTIVSSQAIVAVENKIDKRNQGTQRIIDIVQNAVQIEWYLYDNNKEERNRATIIAKRQSDWWLFIKDAPEEQEEHLIRAIIAYSNQNEYSAKIRSCKDFHEKWKKVANSMKQVSKKEQEISDIPTY